MEKKDRREIFKWFVEAFKGKDFKVVSGLNPCIVEYNRVRINVYIKNLTPAQLSNNNPDIWRCQLPARPIFDDFKISDNLFLLLGYDATNDVYTTWNPYWTKQRLNVGTNISMYSRYSVQKEAAKTSRIIKYDLNHNGMVVAMPRCLLSHYIDHISEFFEQETTYVAIGSSLKKDKNHTNTTPQKPYKFSKEKVKDAHLTVASLSNVCTPDVLQTIAHFMCMNDPQELEALQALSDCVGSSYNQSMSINDWLKLLRDTDWEIYKNESED